MALDSFDKKLSPFCINFLSKKMLFRLRHISLRKELLAKAIGVHPTDKPSIIDATAGLGRDSFILAALGFQVTMLERSPILHSLLADALMRAKANSHTAAIVDKLQLIHTDAITWLTKLAPTHRPAIIYLDPMFPERKKTAAPKKEMVILQQLLGKDNDATALFTTALACATQRIVVKRLRLAGTMTPLPPHFSLVGNSSRFDVYVK